MDEKQMSLISKEEFDRLNAAAIPVALDIVQVVSNADSLFPVVLGSSLPFLDNKEWWF